MAGSTELARRLTTRLLGRRGVREQQPPHGVRQVDTTFKVGLNACTAATGVAGLATLAGVVVLFAEGAPSDETAESFEQFFSAAAQVLIGLLIALAIELRGAGVVTREGRARFEVLLALTWIGLGLGLSLTALLPDCPDVVLAASAVTVPATVLGALVAIVSLVPVTPPDGVVGDPPNDAGADTRERSS